MRRRTLMLIVIVVPVILAGVVIGPLIISGKLGFISSHTGSSTYLAGNQSGGQQKCTVEAIGSIGLTVVNSSSDAKPIPGLIVKISESTPMCAATYELAPMITDAGGTIVTQGAGNFTFFVTVNGTEYSASAQAGAMELTCVTLYVPSNQVVVKSSSLPPTPSC